MDRQKYRLFNRYEQRWRDRNISRQIEKYRLFHRNKDQQIKKRERDRKTVCGK